LINAKHLSRPLLQLVAGTNWPFSRNGARRTPRRDTSRAALISNQGRTDTVSQQQIRGYSTRRKKCISFLHADC